MKQALTCVDLCCGIGGLSLAAARNGITPLFACDTDPKAAATYFQNLGIIPRGDIRRIADAIPAHDILTAGIPCQPFSIMGQQRGLHDPRGALIHAITAITASHRPKAVLLENVANLAAHNAGATLKQIAALLKAQGYAVSWAILNARHFALPQQRRRIYIAAIAPEYGPVNWPILRHPCPPLESLLEPAAASRYYAAPEIRRKAREKLKAQPPEVSIWHTNRSGAVTARPYSAALRAAGSHNYLLVNGERRLTETEMLRLQGFPEDFRLHGSYSQAKKHTGNAVAVPAAAAALRSIKHALERPVTPQEKRREALARIRKMADALANRNGFRQASEDVIEMAGECGAALKQMLSSP